MRATVLLLAALAALAITAAAQCSCDQYACKTCNEDCSACLDCAVCYRLDQSSGMCRPKTSQQCTDWFDLLRSRNNKRYPYPKAELFLGEMKYFRNITEQWYQVEFSTKENGGVATAGIRISAALVDDMQNIPIVPDPEENAVNYCVDFDQYHCKNETIGTNPTITAEHGCCPAVWELYNGFDVERAGLSQKGTTPTSNFPFHSAVFNIAAKEDADLGFDPANGPNSDGVPFVQIHFYFIDEAERYSFRPGACEGASGVPIGFVPRRNGQVDCEAFHTRVLPSKDYRFHPVNFRRFWAVPYMGDHWFPTSRFIGPRLAESINWSDGMIWGLLEGKLRFQLITVVQSRLQEARSGSYCGTISQPLLSSFATHVARQYCVSYHEEGDYFLIQLHNFQFFKATTNPRYVYRRGPKTAVCENCGDAFIRSFSEETADGQPIAQGFEISDDAVAFMDQLPNNGVPMGQWNAEWNDRSSASFADNYPGRVTFLSGLGINATVLNSPASGLDLNLLTANLPSGLNLLGAVGVKQIHFTWDMLNPMDMAPDGDYFDPNYRWGFGDEKVTKALLRPCDWQLSLGYIPINNIAPLRGNLYAQYSYLLPDATLAEQMGQLAPLFPAPYAALGIFDANVYNLNSIMTVAGLMNKKYDNHCVAVFWGNVKRSGFVPKKICVTYDADQKLHRISAEGLVYQDGVSCSFQGEPESFSVYPEEFIPVLRSYFTPDANPL